MTLLRINHLGFPKSIDGSTVSTKHKWISKVFSAMTKTHPCIGARVTGSGSEEKGHHSQFIAIYPDMETVETAFYILKDLKLYYSESDELEDPLYKTLALVFDIHCPSQKKFAKKYWKFLQTLHNLDSLFYEWDPTVSNNIADPNFELSLCGRAVFTTTLNNANPRAARNSPHPTWVINQKRQFDYLRENGIFTDWKRKIRSADSNFDISGKPNPILEDHGHSSAADQLAGSKINNLKFKTNKKKLDKEHAKRKLLLKMKKEKTPSDIIKAIENTTI